MDGRDERKHPINSWSTAVARLPHHADHLQPAEDLFHALPRPLAHRITGMPRRPAIERTGPRGVLGDVGRHLQSAQRLHEGPGIVRFLGADGHAVLREAADGRSHAVSRSACPVARVTSVSTTNPCRFSISTWPR